MGVSQFRAKCLHDMTEAMGFQHEVVAINQVNQKSGWNLLNSFIYEKQEFPSSPLRPQQCFALCTS